MKRNERNEKGEGIRKGRKESEGRGEKECLRKGGEISGDEKEEMFKRE